nr:tetratricopeptide repeat protein [Nocardioidaceae bacterium]
MADAEHLYDAAADGLVTTFPPLRSLGTEANLPRPTTQLIGREPEIVLVQRLLSRPDVRLATLTGPGGSGKTRMALAVAAGLADQFAGVFFIQLSAATDGDSMWDAMAQALGAGGSAHQGPRQRVGDVLGSRAALLVLDNLEQIAGADAVVAELLTGSPDVRVLVTSRRPLHLVAEYEVPVAPLRLPPVAADVGVAAASGAALADAQASEGVQLFVQRAQMVRPGFVLTQDNVTDVVAVCHRLDGLPLALELAAARLKLLTPRALLARLDNSLGADIGGADRPARQRTLRATIAWSHTLLGPDEQAGFRRLAVFQTARDADTLERVLTLDDVDVMSAVTKLVDASLIRVVEGPDGELRVSMLHTVRTFAHEQLLASPDADRVQDSHAAWCAEQSTALERQLRGPAPLAALDAIDDVLPDIRAALRHTLQAGQPARLALAASMVQSLNLYLYRHRFAAEARHWHEALLRLIDDDDSLDLAQALHGAAVAMLEQGDYAPAEQMLERALDITRSLGHRSLEARELNSLGLAAYDRGDRERALAMVEASLAVAEEVGATRRISSALTNLTTFYTDRGDYSAALAAAERALGYERELGDLWGQAVVEINRCVAHVHVHGPADAHRRLVDVAGWAGDVGDDDVTALLLELLCLVLSGQGDH